MRNLTDPAGLGAYQLHIKFTPTVVQFPDGQEMQGGDSPFEDVLTFNYNNTTGALEFSGIQFSRLPGPTQDIVIARVPFLVIGTPGYVATLNLLVESVSNDPTCSVVL